MKPFEHSKVVELPERKVETAGEIIAIVQEMQNRLETLASALSRLEGKISPVLLPNAEKEPVGAEEDAAQTTLGASLLEMAVIIGRITDQIKRATFRVAL